MAQVDDPKPSPSPSPPAPSTPQAIPSSSPSPNEPSSATKMGRRPTFTPEDDLIIVREVAAAKAHLAPFGEVLKRFSTAAERANTNPNLSAKVTTKRLQDRYKKLMDGFSRLDARERMMSGVGGAVGEMEDLLESMLDAQRDMKATKEAERLAKDEQEKRKEEVGRRLMENAQERKRSGEGDESDKGAKGRGKRARMDLGDDMGLEILAASLRETDMARIEVEKERVEVDRIRLSQEREDRLVERELRREEREARDKLELSKFKLMMETFQSTRK